VRLVVWAKVNVGPAGGHVQHDGQQLVGVEGWVVGSHVNVVRGDGGDGACRQTEAGGRFLDAEALVDEAGLERIEVDAESASRCATPVSSTRLRRLQRGWRTGTVSTRASAEAPERNRPRA